MLIILEHGNAELMFLCLRGGIGRNDPAFQYNLDRYNKNIHLRRVPSETVSRIGILAHADNWKHRHANHT